MGESHLKKRGLASLLIVSIIAIAAVFGVVFAFQNSGRDKDVYGSATITVDKPNIELEIELKKDETADKKFTIVETDMSSAYFTITVGGLPESADRGVELNESSISSGVVTVSRVTPRDESGKTGINQFKVTGQNGGAPVTMVFTAVGGRTINVNVNVKLVAQDMKIAPKSHFGLRQGGDGLNLMSADVLNKFIFFAHPDDDERVFTPNNFPIEYKLKEQYPGVILQQGSIAVSSQATHTNQYIYVQAKLPGMTEWLDIPFYVFPEVKNILIDTNATETTRDKVWDLIANRTEFSAANFSFALDCVTTETSDYGFIIESSDTQVVRVDYIDQYQRSLSTVKNLGEVAIKITAYPIIKVNNNEIAFSGSGDANVQVKDVIYVRVRNEFYLESEADIYGKESFVLATDKESVNAFYYEGKFYDGVSFDTFTLDTANGKLVNVDNDVEFELEVVDDIGDRTGVYGWNADNNPGKVGLYSILQIGYWSDEVNDWVMLSGTPENYYANYHNRFCIAFMQTGDAENFLSDNMTLTLRIKSVSELTVGGYASCSVNLDVTSAIDKFQVENLAQFDDGSLGVALVYDVKHQDFSVEEVDVFGMFANANPNGEVVYSYSKKWNTAKVTDNSKDLPFVISASDYNSDELKSHFVRYTITANDVSPIEYYKDYPLTIGYPNGKSYTLNIRVYPTVESLSLSVISNSKGKIYHSIMDSEDTAYDYVRTAYVRKGYTYEFAVDTQGVSVGAYAVFEQITDASGKIIANTTTSMFDARRLQEGLYECLVSLHAYSDSVFAENETEITVYLIVVESVGNVILPSEIELEGITDSAEIALGLTTMNSETITDFNYLRIEVAEPVNKNVIVEQGTGEKYNSFNITAQYLVENTFKVGFKIYKSYNFPAKYDLDGLSWTENLPFELYYIGGNLVTVDVKIKNENPNKIELVSEKIKNIDGVGNYLELISENGKIVEQEIDVKVDSKANYQDFGIGFAEWKNGQFVISAFSVNNNEIAIANCAVARFDAEKSKVYIKAVEGATSLGAYALVVYASDSLRYVDVNLDGDDLVLPDVYQMVSLYIGSKETVEETVEELVSENIHDANSGNLNTRGSYNWILPSTEPTDLYAALFYTDGQDVYGSSIKANVYYIDDLYTVLGWNALAKPERMIITKYVNNVAIGSLTKTDSERLNLDLNYVFNKDTNDDDNFYSRNGTTVHYTISAAGRVMTFYIVESIAAFDVSVKSASGSGLVSRKVLTPSQNTNRIDSVTMQRGNEFSFTSNLSVYSGWKMQNKDFDSSSTAYVSYAGGLYSFYPYIEFTTTNGTTHCFNLDALTSKVQVKVKGGVSYLNIAQDSIVLDGVTTAIYDLTMRVDQENWSPSILNYSFLYDGIYYNLFEDNQTISYVNMEGGKSKLEFKLTCLNADSPVYSNLYYTYYLKIEVAVVILVPDVNPFYNISGARLIITENLNNSPLLDIKTPASDFSALSLTKQGINNVTMAHFADTEPVAANRSAVTLVSGQSDAGIIYLDEKSVGGILVVYPTLYYINVSNINLWTSQPHTEKVLIGTDLSGKPIYDTVVYTIGFTQMIYNQDDKFYQPYVSGSSMPKMVSSWSKAEGYKWDGKYYFKTSIISNSQFSHRLPDGTSFGISVSIQGESNAKAIVENMNLVAKYRDSFVVTPDDNVGDYAVCTMTQTQHQAIGTTGVYDIAFPSDCIPNYADFTFNGISSTNKTIDSKYATITIDSVARTLSVYLKGDVSAIGESLEVRIPYKRPGDYVNPYLSVVIVPVYFEFDEIEVINHYETCLQITRDELTQLKYRALFEYDTSMLSSSMSEKMAAFNYSLQTSDLVRYNYETVGKVTIEIAYSYVNGVPVITKNGAYRYARTYNYEFKQNALIKRTEYLAVGTAATYTFENWNPLHINNLYLEDALTNSKNIENYWDKNLKTQNRNTVLITISLENKSSDENSLAYEELVKAGKIVINVFSNVDVRAPQLELTIIPVWFTFDEFKLQKNPVNPLVALSTPTVLTVEAGNIVCVEDSNVTKALNAFNVELTNAQNYLSDNNALSFSRVANEDGILNFSFNSNTRAITRTDAANPVTATSYLLVSAGISYVNGVPTLDRNGTQISTYFPVRTFGNDVGESDNLLPDLEVAPNGRTRTVAQAIGTSVRYNISLSGVAYDSLLDKYEIRADGNYVWSKDFAWDVVFSFKENIITVNLDKNTELFDKLLSIRAYDRNGALVYVLNIIPAYYTVEQILLADHIDENPIMIKNTDNWLMDLSLDFASSHSSESFPGFDLERSKREFLLTLNSSSLVSRLDDAGFVTVFAGVTYEGGIPSLVNLVNAKTVVQNTYRYLLVDGVPENTKAQALGQEVIYNVNRTVTVGAIKISTGKDSEGNDIWEVYDSGNYQNWWIENDTNPRRIKVGLNESTDLIGNLIRIGIWGNVNDDEPSYILNIIPAYFTVDDLTVVGQSTEDRDIHLYYGEEKDSPSDVVFDAVYGKYSMSSALNVPALLSSFVQELQDTKSNLIERQYDTSLASGDLHIVVYLDYQNGKPTLVDSATESEFIIRIDVDFTYTIYGKPAPEGDLPPMPSEPRSRTEVQAIGTKATYIIDLDQDVSLDVSDLRYDDAKLQERGWKVTLEDNIVTVELLADAAETLLKNDIVLNFYSSYESIFILTIQPVLFEVIGVETIYPEQPIDLTDRNVNDIYYRAVAKYNDAVEYNGDKVIEFIKAFNTKLNSERNGLLEVETVDQYLKINIALDYGVTGSNYRRVPSLLEVESYPLNVVESYVEFSVATERSNVASRYQAVGTTEFYYLGVEFDDISELFVSVGGSIVTDGSVVAQVIPYGNSFALKVSIAPSANLVGQNIIVAISGSRNFTMTIKPVWFVVEGFDVINHPERHLWLITSDTFAEKIDNLTFRVRARYSFDGDADFQTALRAQIDSFNQQLVEKISDLETYTVGAEYLVVRAGIDYQNGVASIINIEKAKPTQVVRDVFKYVRYSDKIAGTNMARPNIPRSRTVEVAIGKSATYTVDFPDLAQGFTDKMISLYENTDKEKADDDSALVKYENGTNGWSVKVVDNQLQIILEPNADLVERELKVFIYYDKNHVKDAPNSFDNENVAFILTIHPVWFKVVDFALNGYVDDVINVDSIDDFMEELAQFNTNTYFMPVYEYSNDVLNDSESGAILQEKMHAFTKDFKQSTFVSRTRVRESATIYHFQVSASVNYQAYEGTAKLSSDFTTHLSRSFKVVVGDTAVEQRVESQAIGTKKTYYIDSSIMDAITSIPDGSNYRVTWNSKEKNYVTVELTNTASVDVPVNVVISNNFTLKINPVYYEILGFETVDHPERAVWVISPLTTKDLRYRAITTEIEQSLSNEVKNEIKNKIEELNLSLNSGSAPISINVDSNENIVIDAAVNYVDGYPEIVEITKDKRNVVESIIPYRIWSVNIRPIPDRPTVVGSTAANQIIGGTKKYTLKNIRGQVFYQFLWVENAGDIVTSFSNSINGTLQTYENLSILVDPVKGTLEVQLVANTDCLKNNIRICIPYLTTVNGKDVWYSHCIEITPLLFELKGWTIQAADEGVAASQLIQNENNEDYLLLTNTSNSITVIKYVAKIKASETTDPSVLRSINLAKQNIENAAAQYITPTVTSENIGFGNMTLRRNVAANVKTDNVVGLSTYIVYENGVPRLVEKSKTLVSNQILISTGYGKDEWNEKVGDTILSSGFANAVQVIGTSAAYVVEIADAGKIFADQITVVDQITQEKIVIDGEQSDLVTVKTEVSDDNSNIVLYVDLAPVIALRNYNVEIKIPYADEEDATKANYVYSYCVTPVLYTIDGFYLDYAENNYIDLANKDIPLVLHVQATYSDDVKVRNMVNLLLQDFELALNRSIVNGQIEFVVENINGGKNVRIESFGGNVWIQKIADKDVDTLDYIKSSIEIGYNGGVPQIGSVNPLTDSVVNITLQAGTQFSQASGFPGWEYIESQDKGSQHLQSIGTSRNYPIDVTADNNITLYYEYIEVFDGGLNSGENEYEFFAVNVVNPGRQNLMLGFTLRSSARILTQWIDVRIPYTQDVDGKIEWGYYSLKIKPVLFEIKSWKLKVDGELVDSVTLDDAAVELYFSPEIVSGPLDQIHYTLDELNYINNAIRRLELEINTYDPRISDGYTYMVINNTAQEGHQVNYTIFRENSTNTSYFLRDSSDESTTVMQLSANIAYGVNDFSKEFVEGAQAVTSYSNSENAKRVTGQISVYTTKQSNSTTASDRSTVFITQDNASLLMKLNENVDYILMSDIYLFKIPGLTNGKWKPVDFPSNATLDGNNHKIYFNNIGFDLSDNPNEIGLFKIIPTDSVIKNVQIVLEHGVDDPNTASINEGITVLEANLENYGAGAVNVGLLAGINNGIITNCAILSEWQFTMRDLSKIVNPTLGNNEKFKSDLPFNKDGYMFDDKYFYKLNADHTAVEQVYNEFGYGITKNETTGVWEIEYDQWHNVKNWITPDRTVVAHYDDYSPIMQKFNPLENNQSEGDTTNKFAIIDSVSAAKFYVYANNKELSVTLGGLVGTNSYMITNSRVLIDVELYGPKDTTNSSAMDEVNVLDSIVGGIVGVNMGTITTSYYRDGTVTNNANADTLQGHTSLLGGFVGQNNGIIQQSYAMGRSTERERSINHISTAGAVKTIRNSLGGFVHLNSGTITDCLVNMVIYKTGTEGSAGGFVYQNTSKGVISNCIENNNIILQSGGTFDYYSPFVVINGDKDPGKIVTTNLSNLIYAGNAESISFSADWDGVLKHLSNNSTLKYDHIANYEGFSMGMDNSDVISADNTIWEMTELGPVLRAANEIAISYRKYTWNSSPYLYNPGTEKNPYLVWTEDQFNDYVYGATPQATQADKETRVTNIEKNRQNNHLRLVDNVTLNGIKDTYKIIYTGTFEGNGLTMDGIGLDTVTNDLAVMGLFGKTEYATIRNINFGIGNINSTARYVGGIAGIAINTDFVDVKVSSSKSNEVIKGANIVGGFVGLNVVNDSEVENYNLYGSVSVTANFHNQQTDVGANLFGSGKEYCQQTLYAKVEGADIYYEQGFGTAGAIFGFVTSNPNNYRIVNSNGTEEIVARKFEKEIIKQSADGEIYYQDKPHSYNTEKTWFLKDRMGKEINDTNVYYRDIIVLQNVGGAVKDVSANVAGGLIGIMDETIHLQKPNLVSLNSLSGKYYLGGIVGINLGKISGEVAKNNEGVVTSTYSTADLGSKWTVLSSSGESYVYRDNNSVENANKVWGMTVGAIAGSNDGFYGNINSGVIENIHVNVNVLGASSSTKQYVIGGVVGANGNYGLIDNAINTNNTVALNTVRVNASQVQKIGYYFGQIVGYSSVTNSSFTGTNTTRMTLLQVLVPENLGKSYVNAEDFSTKNYKGEISNAFGIVDGETLKMQTMTLEEYKKYLLTTITSKDLATRVEMLEPWLRSLPTVVTKRYMSDGQEVRVELFDESAKQELLNWITENQIFEKWDFQHQNLTGKAMSNYKSYIAYSSVSDKLSTVESENDFIDNINKYRQQRYNNAYEFFTYQYRVSGGISSAHNIDFTWDQYEKYLLFKKYATSTDVATGSDLYIKLRDTYNEDFANMVYPYNVWAEYATVKDKNGNDTNQKQVVIINNNKIFCEMVAGLEKDNSLKFTNKDPLQIYINYTVQSRLEENPFAQMQLAQYYYYMGNLYGQRYEDYGYSVPGNFEATGGKGYSSYLSLNALFEGNTAALLTVSEFIYMMDHEEEIVVSNELAWVKTGHLGGGNARISSIGALELGWVSQTGSYNNSELNWKDNYQDIQNAITEKDGVISYTNNSNTTYEWKALNNYITAKVSAGLTIAKYKEIITLGGTLYDLINSYQNDGTNATDEYIFALKAEQYNWTQQQASFVKNNYAVSNGTNVTYDMQYALSATTYGNVITTLANGNVRAVYKTDAQHLDVNNNWFTDNNGDGIQQAGEPVGIYAFPPYDGNTQFVNGDGQVYYFFRAESYVLGAHGNIGAAIYIDTDGNKLFGEVVVDEGASLSTGTFKAGKDILILYKVEDSAGADFSRREKVNDIEKTVYYKIARQVTQCERVVTSDGVEATDNNSDYLEEALWWKNEGFSATEFDKIKAHAMTKSVPVSGRVDSTYTNRAAGYTLADDWKYGSFGFKSDKFTTAEYVEIVLGAQYQGETWNSTYADYLIFVQLYNAPSNGVKTIDTSFGGKKPSTSHYVNPFSMYGDGESDYSPTFIGQLATENDLAEAIEFASDRAAFLALFRAKHTAADYIHWAHDFKYQVWDNKDKLYLNKFFRLNHYIYYVQQGLDEKLGTYSQEAFAPDDFKWVLNQEIRSDIFYNGVTQEARTTDLVEYRMNWYNNGEPFMTYRDYCEWINIYAYNDDYSNDRGDMPEVDVGTGEPTEQKSTEGWLTIDAFAVWKRMEKYENNVEYLAKIGGTTDQSEIFAPILKRQISTTVFPKIKNSGEREKDEKTYVEKGDYVLKQITEPKVIDNVDVIEYETTAVKYYDWDDNLSKDDYDANRMDPNHQRHFLDRYEYNERYNIREINRGSIGDDSSTSNMYSNATNYINDAKFAKVCDHECGGKSGIDPIETPTLCTNSTHAAYQVIQWNTRYGVGRWSGKKHNGEASVMYVLKLDESKITSEKIDQYTTGIWWWKETHEITMNHPEKEYAQLYIPFDYFKRACQQIKSVYSSTNGYAGYFNYMKFWARNGGYNWICDFSEYDGPRTGVHEVSKTYLETAFWNSYDGTKTPLKDPNANTKAIIWHKEDK